MSDRPDAEDTTRALDGIMSAVGLLGALTGADDEVGVVARNELRFAAYIIAERSRAERVVSAVRHALEHSVHPVEEGIIQAMREGGFWVGEQKR